MVSWMIDIFEQTTRSGEYAIIATLLFVAMLAISFAVAAIILVRLPSDYLHAPRAKSARDADHGMIVPIAFVLKNFLGVVLILIGAILAVPGVPGQGLLTMLVGFVLLDVPGKHSLLCKILTRPSLLQATNRLRARFSRPPLVVH
jgi:archaellum biogenesis protein FlaJ (TadC family)